MWNTSFLTALQSNLTTNISLAKDFFKRLCVVNHKARYTAEEALKHPWITREFNDPIPLSYHDYLYESYLKKNLINILRTFVYLSQLPVSTNVVSRNVLGCVSIG